MLFELSLALNSSLIINLQSCNQQSRRYGETLYNNICVIE